MRVEFASATGCPYGQFVIHGESEQDFSIIETFLKGAYDERFRFRKHGYTYSGGHIRNFNFGWAKPFKKQGRVQKTFRKLRMCLNAIL